MKSRQEADMDLGIQKDAVAFEMQTLFDDYKAGDPQARIRLESIIRRFGNIFDGEDALRMRLEQDYKQNNKINRDGLC